MSAFDFSNYEKFIKDVIQTHSEERGYKTKLANAAKVHPSFITRILDGSSHITPDQAAALAEFWGLQNDEREYFIWLVIKARAADRALIQMADKKLSELKLANEDLSRALPAEKASTSLETEYYMSWIYSAIHMFATLPNITLEKLSRRLYLPFSYIKSTTLTLEKLGLVEILKDGTIRATKSNIHLSSQRKMANTQHKNWRIASAERISYASEDDFRYTAVHSLSKKDLEKLKRKIREFLLETDKIIRPSPEEIVCVLCMDLFEL